MHLGRIEFNIVLFMDWSFASGCSPPHISTTQLPSATDRPVLPSGRDFHPSVGAYFQAHLPRHFVPGYYQPVPPGQKPFAHRTPRIKLALMGFQPWEPSNPRTARMVFDSWWRNNVQPNKGERSRSTIITLYLFVLVS